MSPVRLFLCTDLDRTLLPNGPQPESSQARSRFGQLVDRAEVVLTYVTGRHLELVKQAIYNYQLPSPRFAITDVGTKIQTCEQGDWRLWEEWEQEIAADWAGQDHDSLHRLFVDLKPLRLQQTAKQNTHKLSYYLPVQTDFQSLQSEMHRRLQQRNVRASLVWSIDEPAGVGLLDVLPQRATKLHAVEFLRQRLDVPLERTLFAGDSGNDLEVMASAIPSVLVANAAETVKAAALQRVQATGQESSLYLASGGYCGMNGNYSAGILEGVAHFHPELTAWIE